MSSITFKSPVYGPGGVVYDAAQVVAGLTLAQMAPFVNGGFAFFTGFPFVKPLPVVAGVIPFLSDVNALAGAAPAGLAGYLVAPAPVGAMYDVHIAGEVGTRRYAVIAAAGEVPDGNIIISPPDNATDNNKLLVRVQ